MPTDGIGYDNKGVVSGPLFKFVENHEGIFWLGNEIIYRSVIQNVVFNRRLANQRHTHDNRILFRPGGSYLKFNNYLKLT